MASLPLDKVVHLTGHLHTNLERLVVLWALGEEIRSELRSFDPCAKQRAADPKICVSCMRSNIQMWLRCQVLQECRDALKESM